MRGQLYENVRHINHGRHVHIRLDLVKASGLFWASLSVHTGNQHGGQLDEHVGRHEYFRVAEHFLRIVAPVYDGLADRLKRDLRVELGGKAHADHVERFVHVRETAWYTYYLEIVRFGVVAHAYLCLSARSYVVHVDAILADQFAAEFARKIEFVGD